MSRVLHYDIELERVWIEFNYDPQCVDVVKSLPNREYDPSRKQWWIPTDDLEECLAILEPLSFSYSPVMRAFLSERPDQEVQSWTVGRLNRAANAALDAFFEEPIWVVAELSDYRKAARFKPAFFKLVERRDDDVVAQISAVSFWDARLRMWNTLRDAGVELDFADGVSVRMLGSLRVSKKGHLSFNILDIDPTYTIGAQQLQRERIFAQLVADGMAELNRQKQLPFLPFRIALITSDKSDAQADFLDEIQSSPYAFQVTAIDARVQGAQTESTVLAAFRYVARHPDRFDAVAVVRGGGSRTDLSNFDTMAIGQAVCMCPVKVLVGVGHQQDTCLLDMICESHKTPTATARALVDRAANSERRLLDANQRLAGRSQERLVRERQHLDTLLLRSRVAGERGIKNANARLNELAERIGRRGTAQAASATQRVGLATQSLDFAAKGALSRAAASLELLEVKLDGRDPKRVMERGFAIVTSQGKVLRSKTDVKPGAVIEIGLVDGEVRARVEDD